MNTGKKFTNQTYTRRVDHEAGQHRTEKAIPEPAVCEVCGDIYSDRRWTVAEAKRKTGHHAPVEKMDVVVCPACERQRSGIPSGYLHMDGKFVDGHWAELKRLINNEVHRVAEDNPLARIMGWETDKAGMTTVTTTTEHLAQRLGHAVEKAFDGEVRYDFSHENKLAHVWWHRD